MINRSKNNKYFHIKPSTHVLSYSKKREVPTFGKSGKLFTTDTIPDRWTVDPVF